MGYSKTPIADSLLVPGDGEHLPFPNGDADESPFHSVTVSSFKMSKTEVTNKQYEAFDPTHKELRGKVGFSKDDDEAAIFVSWYNASSYAKWLGSRLGKTCRLPTEAEWEFAARGNSKTNSSYFWTGNSVPKEMYNNQNGTDLPGKPGKWKSLPLHVGRFQPNSFGLFDTLGNVEEWVHDWHGPYGSDSQINPAGPKDGIFKGTRGGSHSTAIYYLRTANRAGALPADQSWYIGFRVLCDGTSIEQVPQEAQAAKRSSIPALVEELSARRFRVDRGHNFTGCTR